MTTKIYIAVQGTCTAGPDDNLHSILEEIASGRRKREFSEKLNRDATGGGTVLWVKTPEGIYMIDSGDEADRATLEKSLNVIGKEEKNHPMLDVRRIYHTHAHPDHIANNDWFRNAYWLFDAKNELLEFVIGHGIAKGYNEKFKEYYLHHQRKRITAEKFLRYSVDDHPGRPKGLRILSTPGHDRMHKSFVITDDDEIVIVNCETGAEQKASRLVFAGDAICDERYLARALSSEPEVQKTAVYGNRIPTNDWVICDPVERAMRDEQNLQSIKRIIHEAKKGWLMVFGHGGVYDTKNL